MNFEPLIKSISKLVGATERVAESSVKNPARVVKPGGSAHTNADVERWLGPLSAPEKQVPLIHDYLRGHAAIAESEAVGSTHVRDISVPVWQSAQKLLQSQVDNDPEVQAALKNIFVGRNTPKDPDVTTARIVPEPPPGQRTSVEVPPVTTSVPVAKPARALPKQDALARKQQADAWNEFAVAVESQEAPRIDAALERIKALHDADVPGKPGETPEWERAVNYMAGLEQQVQQWQAARVTNEAWSKSLEQFKQQSGIDVVPLPRHIRDTVERFEAWADAQKPPTSVDRIGEVLGVPRAVMSSSDLSAPGRQGLLMISRPEYWSNLSHMTDALKRDKFLESQAYVRNHPHVKDARDAGLALTDVHSKLAPREEAFQSRLAERIPVLGNLVRASEQSYTTFLNRLRLDVFSNSLREAAAAGVDVKNKEFTKSLAEWVNTSTGRGGRNFNPGVLSSVLFSPRLAVSRFQTFNPWYYYKMHPFVRKQAIKANLSAAAFVYGLVSMAALGGAKVTWDFRNPDGGKIRVGNTRIDIGGGHFQFLRLFAQIASRQKVNAESGKVTNLGEGFGAPTALDVVQNFIVSKEAPVASLVTDWLRGKDQSGKKFNLTDEVIERMIPLAMQDVTETLKDQGVNGLLLAAPALVGAGVQTYEPNQAKANVPFAGVLGEVPPEHAAEYAKLIEAADARAAVLATKRSKNMSKAAAKVVLQNFVRAERMKVRLAWIKANRGAYVEAKKAGEETIPLKAPQEEQ